MFVFFNRNEIKICCAFPKILGFHYLTIRLRVRGFYEQIVNEAQPSWLVLSLLENEGE